jgi:hypothetical protein
MLIYNILFILDLILNLILDLIFILIFLIRPHIRKYLIFFFILGLILDITFLFDRYFLYFGCIYLGSDLFDFYLCSLYDLINIIRDTTYLDFFYVMLILRSIFTKDVTLFNYLFCFFLFYIFLYIYILI